MKTDIIAVAKKAGVSITTVSRVLNHRGYVAENTRNKVLEAIRALRYQPNRIASNMRRKNTNYIGLMVPSITYDFFSNLAITIEEQLHKRGFSLFLCNTNEDLQRERHYFRMLLTNQICGLIMISSDIQGTSQLLDESRIPVILIDRFEERHLSRSNTILLSSDHYQGGRIAAENLLASGAKKLVYLKGIKKTRPQMLREEGFVAAVHESGLSKRQYLIVETETNPSAVCESVVKLYRRYRFDGLFCANDRIAFGALYGLLESNIKVPEHVQVIGFDDIEIGQFLKPALSTIRQNVTRIGEIAAEKIIDMAENGKKLNEKIFVPVEFIKRQTTK